MKRTMERAGSALFFLAFAFVFFVGGALVMLTGSAPAGLLRDAYRAGEALMERQDMDAGRGRGDFWLEARTSARGTTTYDEERAFEGYTLYTSGDGPYARLIDMDGNTLHEWRKPYSEVWTVESAVKQPRPDEFVYMDEAKLLPDGSLIAIYIGAGASPWGHGLVKLSPDSEVVWSYLEHTHHDFDIGPQGEVFVLTNEFIDEPTEKFAQLRTPYLNDYLVVLSPNGEELKKVDLLAAALDSGFAPLMYAVPHFGLGDPQHTNTVEYITADKARVMPFAEEGQILINFRDIGVVAILDIEEEDIVWATKGPWIGQHDPSILDNGNILLFDNLGNMQPENRSRVIEFDPETMQITWEYDGEPGRPLDSNIRGASARLPNGNTLIEESMGGRVIEVTRDGEIVWEWVNPVRRDDDPNLIPVVPSAHRITADYLETSFRSLLEPTEENTQ